MQNMHQNILLIYIRCFVQVPQPTAGLSVNQGAYEYTLDSGVLTPEQRASYDKNGFIIVKNCVPKDKLESYRQVL